MNEGGLLSSLSLFTLVAVLAIVGLGFLYFLRKRSNRHPMDTPRGRAADEERRREAERDRG